MSIRNTKVCSYAVAVAVLLLLVGATIWLSNGSDGPYIEDVAVEGSRIFDSVVASENGLGKPTEVTALGTQDCDPAFNVGSATYRWVQSAQYDNVTMSTDEIVTRLQRAIKGAVGSSVVTRTDSIVVSGTSLSGITIGADVSLHRPYFYIDVVTQCFPERP